MNAPPRPSVTGAIPEHAVPEHSEAPPGQPTIIHTPATGLHHQQDASAARRESQARAPNPPADEMARPRWMLHLQAQVWRVLMGIGMLLHRTASPRPPHPSFTRQIKATVSSKSGHFNLSFYVPRDYDTQRKKDFRQKRYPCVINFHGGGFTLGTSHDDARWCGTVVDECNAVVVSVEYRLAPENPFPTAVEDGVDAVLYMSENSDELGIDPDKIALSGFSSGANMVFTVPLRLYDHQTEFGRIGTSDEANASSLNVPSIRGPGASTSNLSIRDAGASTLSVDRIIRSRSHTTAPTLASLQKQQMSIKQREAVETVSICAIVPWYPSCDYTQTREQRRSTTTRKDQDLPALFTDLFDESYLHPPDTIPLDSPYLSPGIAPSSLLQEALPEKIIMHTCEWDMLLAEGEKFHQRLISPEINKDVWYQMIPGVPHGWDKAPNPLKPTPGVKQHYLNACKELRKVFAGNDGVEIEPPGIGGVQGEGTRKSTLVR